VTSRRAFLAGAATILATPLAAEAQPAGRIYRIGLLHPGASSDPNIGAFTQGLRDLGYIEGRNMAIEYRWAEGRVDRLAGLANELAALTVDVLVTEGTPATRALMQATATIPIVMAMSGDAAGTGLVASLARPGGHVTGLSILTPELTGKRLELLKELVPTLSRVALLSNPENPHRRLEFEWAQLAAPPLGLRLQLVGLADPPNDLPNAFSAMTGERVGAFVVLGDPLLLPHRTRIADLAVTNRLPTASDRREYVEAGCLVSYGANQHDLHRRAAYYVDKILKGAKPAELPVEQPTKFELVINLKTAKALGLTIPPSVLARADEVIE
jgi:putative ABC transport system substrate-binding protein